MTKWITGKELLRWVCVSLTLSLTACAVTPAVLCERSVALLCETMHKCISANNKSTDLFKAQFGSDLSDCLKLRTEGRDSKVGPVTITVKAASCAEKTVEAYCNDSSRPVYHPEKAEACLKAWNEVTCDQVTKTLFSQPEICSEICQAS